MINLMARRIVNWIPAIDVDAGARDTLHLTPSVARTECRPPSKMHFLSTALGRVAARMIAIAFGSANGT
ncbi:hypothetical protein IVA80_31595 [Bradyrhizobium sp. 139]|uniref:hypothetical protein n=1 Tax=Bradyrhizobium sp. 139 TaxID=2782616 RepID=UPI001FF749FB|nr:hypothetical protein [Bradyrhizobium sp. 139]MCK1745219.1 hypothetical protein [Bradyrhizobium sp. 139]